MRDYRHLFVVHGTSQVLNMKRIELVAFEHKQLAGNDGLRRRIIKTRPRLRILQLSGVCLLCGWKLRKSLLVSGI
jgi:hypothetical protein